MANDTPCAQGVAALPLFSLGSGFYDWPISLSIQSSGAAQIHYTLDGSPPSESDPRYEKPLKITKTSVVRARAFGPDLIASPTVTQTFFISEPVHLPVLSLVTDPANLWDQQTGIYVEGLDPQNPNYKQHGRAWERPVSLTFFDDDHSLGFALDAGVRIFGGTTRELAKKSFIVYFRKAYGQDKLHYRLFKERKRDSFTSLVIRNGGDDGWGSRSRMRDALVQALAAGEGLPGSAKRSVFLYLNGMPWGIYNLREHIDADYLANNLGFKQADLLRERQTVKAGDASEWQANFAFFASHDLRSATNYAQAQKLVDIKNFTDYQITQSTRGILT